MAFVIPAVRQTVDAATPLPAVVDALADVQTAIATLEALEANLKAQIIASGLPEVCGANVRAKVVEVAASTSIDYKAATQALLPGADLSKFAKLRAGSTSVRIYGYN